MSLSVREAASLSAEELEARTQEVEARSAILTANRRCVIRQRDASAHSMPELWPRAASLTASRGDSRQRDAYLSIRPRSHSGGELTSSYTADASRSTEWQLERLAQEIPVVEAQRAEHIEKLTARMDSALRHVDGLSAHLEDLADGELCDAWALQHSHREKLHFQAAQRAAEKAAADSDAAREALQRRLVEVCQLWQVDREALQCAWRETRTVESRMQAVVERDDKTLLLTKRKLESEQAAHAQSKSVAEEDTKTAVGELTALLQFVSNVVEQHVAACAELAATKLEYQAAQAAAESTITELRAAHATELERIKREAFIWRGRLEGELESMKGQVASEQAARVAAESSITELRAEHATELERIKDEAFISRGWLENELESMKRQVISEQAAHVETKAAAEASAATALEELTTEIEAHAAIKVRHAAESASWLSREAKFNADMNHLRASIVIAEEQQAALLSELQALTMTVQKVTRTHLQGNQSELARELPELQSESHTRLHGMNDAKMET